jgi:hypothetical protein
MYFNKNLSNLISTFNIKFAREQVDKRTTLDKLAFKWLGDERYWYVIALFNNIVDPLAELDEKRELIIPLNISDWIDRI